jgi:hypothetical protein
MDLIKRVLGSNYLDLSIVQLRIEEDSTGTTGVHLVTADGQGNQMTVAGSGCGIVDALFHGLIERYGVEYQSLRSIELVGFRVNARMDTRNQQSGSDALGEITLEVRNSEGTLFSFSDESRSIAGSTARVVLAAMEYFINAERAFITVYKSLKDAQERAREDLVTRYTRELAEIVKSTSYAEVIENIRRELS